MAPRTLVPPLEDLCMQVVVDFIKAIVDSHCKRSKFKNDEMTADLKTVLEYIPLDLHDKLADFHVQGVIEHFGEDSYFEDENIAESDVFWLKTCFNRLLSKICILKNNSEDKTADSESTEFFLSKTYFNRLMSVIDHLQIKKLILENQPAYMERKFSDLFDRMTSLEVFSCKDSWISVGKPGFNFGKLLTAYPALSNLTSFTMRYYCTDKILSVICENCKALRMVDVGRYKSWPCRITDLSIQSLIKCRKLERVNLHNTTVSPDGFLKLVYETKSRRLHRIDGLEMSLDKVLEKMQGISMVPELPATEQETDGMEMKRISRTFRTFQLQELKCHNLDERHLNLTVKYFPHLSEVFFNFCGPTSHRDFSVLSKLKKLRRVGFEFLDCDPDDVRDILSKCPRVVSISLRHKNVSVMAAWLNSISQLCPDIDKLAVCGTDELPNSKNCPRVLLLQNSFKKLTELIWYEPTLINARYILRQATNVQTIHFYRSTDLSDEFFESVFKYNPLSQLKKLTIHHTSNKCCKLSCDTMKRIIANCEQLTHFSILLFLHPLIEEFTSSTRRLVKEKESFHQVTDFIVENNYGVHFEVNVMKRPLTTYRLV